MKWFALALAPVFGAWAGIEAHRDGFLSAALVGCGLLAVALALYDVVGSREFSDVVLRLIEDIEGDEI